MIDSPQAVHLGDLESHGRIDLASEGDIEGCDASNPIPIRMIADDTETTLTVTAGGEISMGSFKGDPSVEVYSGGNVTLCVAAGAFPPEDESTGSGEAGGGIVVESGGGSVTCAGCDSNFVVIDPVTPVVDAGTGSAGGLGQALLLWLGLVAVGRRRR